MFWNWFKKRRRCRLKEEPFPEEWLTILKRNVPYYHSLSRDERRELQGHIHVFLAEKNFEGAQGLVVDDEIRVTIAAQACMLLLNRETGYYPKLQSIIVYPYAFISRAMQRNPDGTVTDGGQARLGESWSRGAVVLSWDDVLRGVGDAFDGRNLVFHEFAHQLDGESGPTDGTPDLCGHSRYITWARVLGDEYGSLVNAVRRHQPTFLDRYGATSPAEFFAVVTETFFEMPNQLRSHNPELYDQLRMFYKQDPAVRRERDV